MPDVPAGGGPPAPAAGPAADPAGACHGGNRGLRFPGAAAGHPVGGAEPDHDAAAGRRRGHRVPGRAELGLHRKPSVGAQPGVAAVADRPGGLAAGPAAPAGDVHHRPGRVPARPGPGRAADEPGGLRRPDRLDRRRGAGGQLQRRVPEPDRRARRPVRRHRGRGRDAGRRPGRGPRPLPAEAARGQHADARRRRRSRSRRGRRSRSRPGAASAGPRRPGRPRATPWPPSTTRWRARRPCRRCAW